MATLIIEATPSEDLDHYRLWLDEAADDDFVPMGANNKGQGQVVGVCRDGSSHILRYVLSGSQGASLGIKMRCQGGDEIPMPTVRIFEFSPAGGEVSFVL